MASQAIESGRQLDNLYWQGQGGEAIPLEISGFCYPTLQQAQEKARWNLLHALENGSPFVVGFDLDEVSFESSKWEIVTLNRFLISQIEGFQALTVEEKVAAGGRFEGITRLKEATATLGLEFGDVYTEHVWGNPDHFANLPPIPEALRLQQFIQKQNGVIGGYPTARAPRVGIATGYALATNGFATGPILHVHERTPNTPDAAKVELLLDTYLDHIPNWFEGRVILIDDRGKTAVALFDEQERCHRPNAIRTFVLATEKQDSDEKGLADLRNRDIPYGTFQELTEEFSALAA